MTLDTVDLILGHVVGDRAHEIAVAVQAVFLQDHPAALAHLDRFVKVLECETVGVPEAVFGLGQIFADDIVRNMAIVTAGNKVVAGFLPAIVLRAHDVAVDTGARVVREVGRPLRIIEGVPAQPNQQANHAEQDSAEHSLLR